MAKKHTNLCNETVDVLPTEFDSLNMEQEIAKHYEGILDALRIDWRNDHNMAGTPKRVAKMYVQELMAGRFKAPPAITDFENARSHNQLMVVGPIEVRSLCAHHLLPIYGYAYIGVLPNKNGRVIGLSKNARVVDYYASRPQIQEELTEQIANALRRIIKPRGLAVRIEAEHGCMTMRGVKSATSRFVTTALRGQLLNSEGLKNEFLNECGRLSRFAV